MTKISAEPAEYLYVYIWFVAFGAMLFALFVAFDLNYIQSMLKIDSSYLSAVSIIIFFGASMHAFMHLVLTSRAISAAERLLRDGSRKRGQTKTAQYPLIKSTVVDAYLSDIANPAQMSPSAQKPEAKSNVLKIYADKLRAPVELGWFIVDLLIRLGLIGTIIGFIIILSSLVGGPLPGAADIQKLLVTMGGGMGTALYTTLSGLVAATLLAVQYIILGRSVEHLLGALIRISERKG